MGPEAGANLSNYLIPPPLKPDTDKMRWIEDINIWTLTVIVAAEAGDGKAADVSATLGLILYRSLEESEKELVQRDTRTRKLYLCPIDSETTEEQIKIAKKVTFIGAKDSTVDRIKCIVTLNYEVHK